MTAPDLAAEDHRGHGSRDRHDHVADFIAAHVVEDRLVVRRVRAVDRHDADGGHGRRVERQHDRRQRARGQVGNHRERQRVDLRQGPVGIDVTLEIIADDAGADDRPRLLPRRAVGLAGPSLHPVGDVVGDAVGRHAAVKRQRLHGRALEDRQDVDRDHRQRLNAPSKMNVSDMTVTAYGLPSDARISPFMSEVP